MNSPSRPFDDLAFDTVPGDSRFGVQICLPPPGCSCGKVVMTTKRHDKLLDDGAVIAGLLKEMREEKAGGGVDVAGVEIGGV